MLYPVIRLARIRVKKFSLFCINSTSTDTVTRDLYKLHTINISVADWSHSSSGLSP